MSVIGVKRVDGTLTVVLVLLTMIMATVYASGFGAGRLAWLVVEGALRYLANTRG